MSTGRDKEARYLQVLSSKDLKLGATENQIQLAIWVGPELAALCAYWYAYASGNDYDDDDDDDDDNDNNDGGDGDDDVDDDVDDDDGDDGDDDDNDDQRVSGTKRSESLNFRLNCTSR